MCNLVRGKNELTHDQMKGLKINRPKKTYDIFDKFYSYYIHWVNKIPDTFRGVAGLKNGDNKLVVLRIRFDKQNAPMDMRRQKGD